MTAFQPAGRTPAPAPLDVLQDFVNTEIPEWYRDDLAHPSELSAWLVARGLLEPTADISPEAFVLARALRSNLRALALANTTKRPPSPEERARRSAELGGLRFVVEIGPDGEPTIAPAGGGAEKALASLVSIAVEAVRDGTWSRFKACRKPSCGWIFYDRSRNRSSNWCSMTICGNRTKTAGYRRRRVAL